MRVTCFLISEFASVSREGKLTIAGTIDSLDVSVSGPKSMPQPVMGTFPIPLPPSYLTAQVEFSLHEGLRHTGRLLVRDEDGAEVVPAVNLPAIELAMNPYGRPMRHNLIMRIAGLAVPRPGDYVFELEIDGKRAGETPLYVTDATGKKP